MTVVLTSLTHPRKILLVVLQIGKGEIGKVKDLSAALRKCLSIILNQSINFHEICYEHQDTEDHTTNFPYTAVSNTNVSYANF
jgi:hypothetical protein